MIKKENPDRKKNLKSSLFTFLKRFCKPNGLWRISPFYNTSPLWNFQVLHVGLSGNLVKWNTFYLMHCSQRDLFISILKKVFPIKTLLNTKNNRWLGKGHTQIHTLEKLENVWYNVIVYIGISPRPFKSPTLFKDLVRGSNPSRKGQGFTLWLCPLFVEALHLSFLKVWHNIEKKYHKVTQLS